MSEDPYKVLGVPTDADAEQVKRAHRRAAREHHPDKGGDRDDFERVQNAYLVLTDPERRAKYDRTGDTEDEVENPLAEMVDAVAAAFDAACAQDPSDLTTRDLISETREIMVGQLATMRETLQGLRDEVPRLEGLLRRLRFSGTRVDPIGALLRSRVEDITGNIAQGEVAIEKYGTAIEYLDHYGFDFDKPPPAHPWNGLEIRFESPGLAQPGPVS